MANFLDKKKEQTILLAFGGLVVFFCAITLAEDIHAIAALLRGKHQCDDQSCWSVDTITKDVRNVKTGSTQTLWFCPSHGPGYFPTEDNYQHINHFTFWVGVIVRLVVVLIGAFAVWAWRDNRRTVRKNKEFTAPV